jgi:outer membrane immunogenic protein
MVRTPLFALALALVSGSISFHIANAATSEPINWSGIYFGAHAGGAWSDFEMSDHTISVAAAETASVSRQSGFAGMQIGYNRQVLHSWLLGTEADISFTDLGANTTTNENAFPARLQFHDFGTVRTRIGYIMDRTLLYATGGLAWAKDAFSYTSGGFVQMDAHQYHLGWTAGLGGEYALDRNWSARIEYLHADFGADNAVYTAEPRMTKLTADMVRLALNYRLGAPEAALPEKTHNGASSIWNGSYIGASFGNGRNSFNLNDQLTPNPVFLNPNGLVVGAQAGYNYRLSSAVVVGLEADQSFGSMSANIVTTPVFTEFTNVRIDQFGSARARGGFLWNNAVLGYITGGFAWARSNFSETSVNGIDAARKEYRVGPVVGAGFEIAVSSRASIKAEYLHADFGTSHDAVFDVSLPVDFSLKTDIVRAGFNINLD